MKLTYLIIEKKDITSENRNTFGILLKKQGKVVGDVNTKADRCIYICIVNLNEKPIAIGAIKQKTASDFSLEKANLPNLEKSFDWELGYIYTSEGYEGIGLASNMVKLLIKKFGDKNLMASTEISRNPAMVSILKKNGFKHYGTPWKSSIHENHIGLFLKFK